MGTIILILKIFFAQVLDKLITLTDSVQGLGGK